MRSVSGIGYSSIDLWTCGHHFYVDSDYGGDIEHIKKLLQRYHLRIVSMTPRQSCPNPFHMAAKGSEMRERTERYFQNVILAAERLGCTNVLITSGWQYYSEPRQDAWDRSVDMTGRLCRFSEKHGVKLAMETLSSQSTTLVNRLEDLRQMEREVGSEAFAVTADIHTIHNAGEDLQDYFDVFGEKLVLCHFMDYRVSVRAHLAWGDGEADMPAWLDIFRKNGYEGYFVLEFNDSRYLHEPGKTYRKTYQMLTENI